MARLSILWSRGHLGVFDKFKEQVLSPFKGGQKMDFFTKNVISPPFFGRFFKYWTQIKGTGLRQVWEQIAPPKMTIYASQEPPKGPTQRLNYPKNTPNMCTLGNVTLIWQPLLRYTRWFKMNILSILGSPRHFGVFGKFKEQVLNPFKTGQKMDFFTKNAISPPFLGQFLKYWTQIKGIGLSLV